MTPPRLRLRLFVALSGAALAGSFATGLFAVLVDREAIGFAARALSVAPKAAALALFFLPLLALGARLLANLLARPVEQIARAAVRVAQGERLPSSRRPGDRDALHIEASLRSLRQEIDRGPLPAALLRDACHDLRNPLAAVRASLELLGEGDLPPAATARFVANAARSADALDRQLEALVTLSRYESAALAPARPASMGDLVREAVDLTRPLAEARGVDLVLDPPAAKGAGDRIVCDRAALGRALENLLRNACAATPARGAVRASWSVEDEAVLVDVSNEPSAVARDLRPLLFDRAAASARRAGGRLGTGLGLAIARAAVEAHGGRVFFLEWGPPRVHVRLALPR